MTKNEITFPKSGWDRACFPLLKSLKSSLHGNAGMTELSLNFENTEWIEPQSLLTLVLLVERACDLGIATSIHFGDIEKAIRQPFLKFVGSQGFISCFPETTKFFTSNQAGNSKELGLESLESNLTNLSSSLLFTNQDLLAPQLINLTSAVDDNGIITQIVDGLIEEMGHRSEHYSFRTTSVNRQTVFPKLKTFLSEAIQNISEHAREESGWCKFSVFGRIRQGVPNDIKSSVTWHKIHNDEYNNAITLSSLQFNKRSEWIELFICDIGGGILTHSASWQNSNLPEKLKLELAENIKSKQPLNTIAPKLFLQPISRYTKRNEQFRTKVTGLQAIGKSLRFGGAHIRICDGTESVGNKFPWTSETMGSRWIEPSVIGHRSVDDALGTFISLSMQPFEEIQRIESNQIIAAGAKSKSEILQALTAPMPQSLDEFAIFDRRFKEKIRPVSTEISSSIGMQLGAVYRVVVRLPKRASKQDFAEWVHKILELGHQFHKTTVLYFVDCGGMDAETYCDYLPGINPAKLSQGRIVLLTRAFESAVFMTKNNRIVYDSRGTFSFASGTNQNTRISQLASILKAMDSDVFWSDGDTVPIEQVYKAANCVWRTRTETGAELKVFGYLDFQSAILDMRRYQTCRRVLLRYVSLLGNANVFVTDDLVSEVAADISGEDHVMKGESHCKLFLGSVVVSGDTLLMEHNIGSDASRRFVSFLVHRDANRRQEIGSLLNWTPPKVHVVDDVYRRVSGTPYVSEEGDYFATINRFSVDSSGRSVSLYTRSPSQTYSDFGRYSALSLGHFAGTTNHDIIRLDTSAMLLKAEAGNEELWRWLISKLDEVIEDSEADWIFLFPSHPTNNRIVRLLSEHYLEDVKTRKSFFQVDFLRVRINEPFLFSPLFEEKIRSVFSSAKRQTKAMIVDISGVTGRTHRQIGQFIQHCSIQETGIQTEIKTTVLLDRSGLPSKSGIMPSFFQRNNRYWRWDVPRLGTVNTCSLCNAISRVRQSSRAQHQAKIERTTSVWFHMWEARKTNSNALVRNDTDLIELNYRQKFGIVKVNKTWTYEYVEHSSIEPLVANIIELTRLTHRSDIALRWESKSNIANEAKLLVISCVLITYQNQFSQGERAKYYAAIIRLLWKTERSSAASGIACLSLFNIDSDSFYEIFETLIAPKMWSEKLLNEDLSTALFLLTTLFEANLQKESPDQLYRENLRACGFLEGYFDYVRDLFDVIGWNDHSWHYSHLRTTLLKFQGPLFRDSNTAVWTEVEALIGLLATIFARLEAIADHLEAAEMQLDLQPAQDARDLLNQIEELRNIVLLQSRAELAPKVREIHRLLFGASHQTDALIRRYRSSLLFNMAEGKLNNSLLSESLKMLNDNWESYLRGKNVDWRGWNPSDAEAPASPSVFQSGIERWEGNGFIYFDKNVIGAIFDTLQNISHSSNPIRSPWNDEFDFLADAWWRLEVSDSTLSIQIANGSTERSGVHLAPKDIYQTIVKSGAELLPLRFENGVCFTEVRLPLIKSEELT